MPRQRPKYIKEYRDRHGKVRIYLRAPGRPRVSLPGPVYSPAFMIAYQAAMAALQEPTQAGAERVKPGSISALVAQYYGSAAFTSKKASTQATYRGILERFREKYGDRPVAGLMPQHIDAILGAEAKRSPPVASNLRKRLVKLMPMAVKWGYRSDNPMLLAERVQYETPGIRTWTEDDVEKFRKYWTEGTAQRIAFEILYYTGMRRSDAVKLGRQHIQGDFIVISTKKSGKIVQLNIPIHEDFRAFLDKLPANHLSFITTKYDAPRGEKGFGNWISEAAEKAGILEQASPQGVRKAACNMLAEAGCSALEIMSITGHRDIKLVELYCRKAQQKKLAKNAITKRHGGAA